MRILFSADDVKLAVAKDAGGKLAPSLSAARNGSVLIELTKSELQGMLLVFAQAGAAEQGAKVESVDLALSQISDQVVAGVVTVKAKKSVMSIGLSVSGQVTVDDRLNVTLSNLEAKGQGILGSLIASGIGGKLKENEGKPFALAPEALKGIATRDLKLDVGDPVRITAKFDR